MERVHALSERAVDEIEGVAVAIYRNRGHIGLLHKEAIWASDDLPVRYVVNVLHLGLHQPLHNDPPDASEWTFWVAPSIDQDYGYLISMYCRLLIDRNREAVIPYGFGQFEGAFDESWLVTEDASRMGLTCSSFVLAVFHRSGLPLIDPRSWPVRDDDRPRMEDLIQYLRQRTDASDEHIERQAELIAAGQVRFRPLEVAGAASSLIRPVEFREAMRLAALINAEFDKVEHAD
jgi:hypothetical protein